MCLEIPKFFKVLWNFKKILLMILCVLKKINFTVSTQTINKADKVT